jgi:hypothetical protein
MLTIDELLRSGNSLVLNSQVHTGRGKGYEWESSSVETRMVATCLTKPDETLQEEVSEYIEINDGRIDQSELEVSLQGHVHQHQHVKQPLAVGVAIVVLRR